MKYYLDCEFDGWNGPLVSLALVSAAGEEFYWHADETEPFEAAFVKEKVIPFLSCEGAEATHKPDELAAGLAVFLSRHEHAHIVADWPDDIAYFCKAMITGPGERIDTPPITFEIARVEAYPTELAGAIQHNALWDARALAHVLAKENER